MSDDRMTERDKNGIQRLMFVVEDRLGQAEDVNAALDEMASLAATMVPAGADREEFKRHFRILVRPLVELELKTKRRTIMKSSALSRYLDRYANRLDPEQQLLAQLPDDAIKQAYAYLFGPTLLPWLDTDKDERAHMRRNFSALNPLSDAELDLTIAVAFDMHYNEEGDYFAEMISNADENHTQRYMSDKETGLKWNSAGNHWVAHVNEGSARGCRYEVSKAKIYKLSDGWRCAWLWPDGVGPSVIAATIEEAKQIAERHMKTGVWPDDPKDSKPQDLERFAILEFWRAMPRALQLLFSFAHAHELTDESVIEAGIARNSSGPSRPMGSCTTPSANCSAICDDGRISSWRLTNRKTEGRWRVSKARLRVAANS